MEALSRDEIARLSPPERLALIEQLWESLEHDSLPLTEVRMAELDRRLETLDADRGSAMTWESVRAELERRCP